MLGYEVEIGFTAGDVSYDKDGIRGLAVFAELAAHHARNGKKLTAHLDDLYKKYGYFFMIPSYYFCPDDVLAKIMTRLRNDFDWDTTPNQKYPKTCGKFKINRIRDVTTGYDSGTPDKKCVFPV